MDKIYIFVSGYAIQNNGEGGIGISFYHDPAAKPFYEICEYTGIETQNSAVYRAILKSLAKAREWNFSKVEVYSDNRLVISQLVDNMSARARNIVPLYDEVKESMESFTSCSVNLVKNCFNKRSRELARIAAQASPHMITAQAIQFEVVPGINGLVLAFTPKLMVVQFKYKKGSKVEPHQHFHEQASYIVKGTLNYVVAEREIIMRKGAALVVSSNAEHQIEALEDTTEIVTYNPMRADLLRIS